MKRIEAVENTTKTCHHACSGEFTVQIGFWKFLHTGSIFSSHLSGYKWSTNISKHKNLLKTEFLKPGEVQKVDEVAMHHEAG